MHRKKQFRVSPLNKKDLKVGTRVYLIDGSSLTEKNNDKNYYIIYAYPHITKSDKILKEIEATVLEVGITDLFSMGVCGYIYPQDIKIQVGEGIFYTSSAHVRVSERKRTFTIIIIGE